MSGSTSHPSGLRVQAADLSASRPPRWAWLNRIVLGYLNLLIGNEGVGKGTLVVWLIARLTRGELTGDLRHEPVAVGIIGDEDSFDHVWTPRLHAAGADLSLVKQLNKPDGGYVHIREDRHKLGLAVDLERIRVLFFDQLLDNLGTEVNDWHGKTVRDALQPLRSIARELDLAVIGCLHPNKRGNSFRELVSGAVAFNAVSRSSLLLAPHPRDESRRVLVRGKGNLSAAPRAIEFEITSHRFRANEHDFNVPLADHFTVGEMTVDELIDATRSPVAEHSKVADAAEIIEALLSRDGAWHPATPIHAACAAKQIDERTVQRAKARLKLEHRRARTFPASTEWRWPTDDDTPPTPDVAVAGVASGKPHAVSSDDTHDTEDSANEGRDRGATEVISPQTDASTVVAATPEEEALLARLSGMDARPREEHS
ncbi:MAG TPA: AAA family ATPase [Solirubrobacteraceae bacterium]